MKVEEAQLKVSENVQDMTDPTWPLPRSKSDQMSIDKAFIDLTGDLVSGILLGRIVNQFLLRGKNHESSLVKFNGKEWLAKTRSAWWTECRITPRQFDRGIAVLRKKQIVESVVRKYTKSAGGSVKHITINWEQLCRLLSKTTGKSSIPVRHRRKRNTEKIPA